MIKGKVRLDLCDALTGRVKERVEGNNTFTDAINSLLNKCPCGADRFSLDGTKAVNENQLNLARTALGGVLLFPSTVGNGLYEVMSHQPTAYSRYGAQDTSDNKTGYWTGESIPLTNPEGFKFVHEWGASYGNGTIKTVCLTNIYGAEAYGKKTFFGNKWMYLLPNLGVNIRPLGWCDGFFYYLDKDNNEFDRTQTIKKISRPVYELLIDIPEMLDTNSTVVYTNPDDSSYNDSRVGLDPDGKKIYIMSGASGTSKTLTTIDLTAGTSSTSTLTFTTSIPTRAGQYIFIVKRGNYLYFCKSYNSGNAVISKINLTNNADYDEISITTATDNGDLFLLSDTNEICGGGFIIGTDDTVYETTSDSQYMIMDRYGVWQAIKMISATGAGSNMVGFQINPYYMASKFVLEDAVTKTSALTMKLVYEVTHS